MGPQFWDAFDRDSLMPIEIKFPLLSALFVRQIRLWENFDVG